MRLSGVDELVLDGRVQCVVSEFEGRGARQVDALHLNAACGVSWPVLLECGEDAFLCSSWSVPCPERVVVDDLGAEHALDLYLRIELSREHAEKRLRRGLLIGWSDEGVEPHPVLMVSWLLLLDVELLRVFFNVEVVVFLRFLLLWLLLLRQSLFDRLLYRSFAAGGLVYVVLFFIAKLQ